MLGDDDEDEATARAARRSSPSWATSTTARPRCSTRIRNANVVAGEAGGITQHIGAYQVAHSDDRRRSPSSTPRATRRSPPCAPAARSVTDIAVLVVAADDGVMPQTIEAINHAKAAEVPIVVAVTKVDRDDADPDRGAPAARRARSSCPRSGAATRSSSTSPRRPGIGVDELLDAILLVADVDRRRARRQPEEAGRRASCSRRTSTRAAARSSPVLVERGHAARRRPDRRRAGAGAGSARCSTKPASRSAKPGRRCRSRCSASPTCRWPATSCASRRTTRSPAPSPRPVRIAARPRRCATR